MPLDQRLTNKVFTWIGGATGILSLLGYIWSFFEVELKVAPQNPNVVIWRNGALTAALFVSGACLVLYLYGRKEQLKRERDTLTGTRANILSKTVRLQHEISHDIRNYSFAITSRKASGKPVDGGESVKSLGSLGIKILDNLHEILILEHGDHARLSLSIKFVLSPGAASEMATALKDASHVNGQAAIITLCRDSRTKKDAPGRLEQDGTKIFSVVQNTAFDELFSGGASIFVDNDLSNNKNYRNQTPGWTRLYNATAVVPIRSFNDVKRCHEVYGFLTVDSPRGGVTFAEDLHRAILGSAADTLAIAIANA